MNFNYEETKAKIQARIEDCKERLAVAGFEVVGFAVAHPQETAAIAGLAVVGLRKADKWMDIYRENRLRNSMIYDRSLGMYWETKRPLTTNQRLIIESRHKAGESYGQILSDMKVLKR